MPITELDGASQRSLRKALLAAFPEESDLVMLVDGLGHKLFQLVEHSDLESVTHELIDKAESQGWLEALVRAAIAQNPGNPLLKAFVAEHLPEALPTEPGELQARRRLTRYGFAVPAGLTAMIFLGILVKLGVMPAEDTADGGRAALVHADASPARDASPVAPPMPAVPPALPEHAASVGAWTAVGTSSEHTCGIRSDGVLVCTGRNYHLQLGDRHEENAIVATPVEILRDGVWLGLVAGAGFTCGIRELQGLRMLDCLGSIAAPRPFDDDTWLLGDGALAAGTTHACALRGAPDARSGQVWCFGNNANGQTGHSAEIDEDPGTQVLHPGGLSWVRVAAGGAMTCAIDTDGAAWCWGEQKNWASHTHQPARVSSDSDWQDIAPAGGGLLCGIRSGRVVCGVWSPAGFEPEQGVWDNRQPWLRVRTTSTHACALRADQTLWCRGHNPSGQLGCQPCLGPDHLGFYGPSPAPGHWSTAFALDGTLYPNEGPPNIGHTCAIDQAGALSCWGEDRQANTALGRPRPPPAVVP